MSTFRVLFALTFVTLLSACGSVGQGQDIQERGVQRVVQADPWLRINVEGHTATVQSLAFTPDSKRLCSAGLDKVVHVWNADVALRDLRRTFLKERTIRWQVARSLRGSLYAVDLAPSDGLLAMGGYGAMGSLGEILLVDPVTGELGKVLEGHRQTVRAVSFSQNGQWLASIDTDGHSRLWNRDGWQSVTLYEKDRQTYGARHATLIQEQPNVRPILVLGNDSVIVPVYLGRQSDGTLRWKLQRIRLDNPKSYTTLDTIHLGMVSALAATPDGRRLVSADLRGNIYLWDLRGEPRSVTVQGDAPVLAASFHPDGNKLAVGTSFAGNDPHGQVQIRSATNGRVMERVRLPGFVHAVRFSPDGNRLAFCGGQDNEVFLAAADSGTGRILTSRRLGIGSRPVFKVAFRNATGDYRVAWTNRLNERGFNDYGQLTDGFDTSGSGPIDGDSVRRLNWLDSESFAGGWEARPRTDGGLDLHRGGLPRSRVEVDAKIEGAVRSYCWIPDNNGRPYAIAVGTDLQNSIFVFRLVERGTCPLLRRFRGHFDRILSLGVSRDVRYLVSGSVDGTIMFWSLTDFTQGNSLLGRWGCRLRQQGNELTVAGLTPAGPLYRKGVRPGDQIVDIRWVENDDRERSENRPAQMVQALDSLPWNTQVVFAINRGGQPRPSFQVLPAWQPVATLYVSDDREWAFWTPEGYYDASANGHKHFGWQVNRGLFELPDFFRADQFRRRLERPAVMEKLLQAGHLVGAFEMAERAPPENAENVLNEQINATPVVSIVSPQPNENVQGPSTKVLAKVRIPSGSELTRNRVFANGVVGGSGRVLAEDQVDGGTEVTYEWDARLPTERRNLIQVLFSTAAETTAFADVPITRSIGEDVEPPQRRLYLIAAAVDEYRDPEIRLNFCVADAKAVLASMKDATEGLYELADVRFLQNHDVTLQNWRENFEELRQKLKDQVRPDDLLLIFLAGHGNMDPNTGEYYFLPYDVDASRVRENDHAGCISWREFELLADIPCRKVALLDTCHSGAVQPETLRHQLKAATRGLQEDVIITVSSTSADEKAIENSEWGHGGFTKVLLDGLEGAADKSADEKSSKDGVVVLTELVTYVLSEVPKLTDLANLFSDPTERSEALSGLTQTAQHPTAAPVELLEFVQIPLTKAQ